MTNNNGNGTAAATTVKVKEFSVNIKDYEDSSYFKKLDAIRAALSKTLSDDTITSKGLATLLAQFLQFYDDMLGRNATNRPNLTKIPMSLFKDYNADGSLYEIFRVMHTFRNTNDWKKFDFKAANRRDKHIEMLVSIHDSLLNLGLLKLPSVYFEDSLNNIEKLKSIVESHGGKIVDNRDSATHIIKTPLEELDEPTNVEYLRTIEHKQKMNLVHWWYYPDSYDAWLSSSDVEGEEPDVDQQIPDKWIVSPRWITDTDIFNEWMNEIDYEEEDNTNNSNSTNNAAGNNANTNTPNKKDDKSVKGKRGRKAKKKVTTPKTGTTPDQEMADSSSGTTEEGNDSNTEESNKRKSTSVPSTPSKKFKQDDETSTPATPVDSTTATTEQQPATVVTPTAATSTPAIPVSAPTTTFAQQPTSPTIPQQPATAKPLPVMMNPLVGGGVVPSPGPLIAKPVPQMVTPMKQPVPGIPNPSTPQPVAINKTPASINTHIANRPRSSSKSTKMDTPSHIAQPMVVTNISQIPAQPQFPGAQPITSAPTSTDSASGVVGASPSATTPTATTTTPTTTATGVSTPPAAKTIGLLSAFSIPPSPCSWFKMSEIHEIERNQLPEFFTGKSPSKNPKIYKEYRDFMINTYLQNPYQYLTLTAIRRNLVGDACSILRVHSFLEHWGLINYFVNPEGGSYIPLPSPQTTQSIKQFHQDKQKEKESPSLTSSGSAVEKEKESSSSSSKENETSTTSTSTTDGTVTSPSTPATATTTTTTTTNTASAAAPTIPKQLITKASPFEFRNNIYSQFKYQCNRCYHDCTKLRFCVTNRPQTLEGQNIPDHMFPMNLCSECFNNGNYPNFLQGTDFTRIEMPAPEMLDEWTDQETLLLLEALDIFADSWTDVAEHVGSKTKEQCLLQFLRLPIEDPYLEDNISKSTQITPNEMELNNPLADMSNPVMSLISFLSTSVSPVVAAAAAQAACNVLISEQDKDKDAAGSTTGEDKEKEKEKEKESDSMDTSSINGPNNTNDDEYFSKVNIQSAAAAALAAASIKAKSLSKVEEKEIQSLILKIVNVQTKKLELKLKYYVELEDGLEKERNSLEKARQNLFAERYSLMKATHTNQQPQPFMTSPNKPLSPNPVSNNTLTSPSSTSTPTTTTTTTSTTPSTITPSVIGTPMNVDNTENK
ncbi:hypothetical protein CYY_004807 [Polysphondylium violaceum]|uniref:Myb domain-containing protein n=1 Tax=Polysphondylium violaceum TaxID=133409 RepID=A0A8J4PU13_9MYCE|nr:hypothetical protein CYY_004807 [Polysphondylium violaceum]